MLYYIALNPSDFQRDTQSKRCAYFFVSKGPGLFFRHVQAGSSTRTLAHMYVAYMHTKLMNTDVRPAMRSPVERYLLNLNIMTVTPDFVFGVLLGGKY